MITTDLTTKKWIMLTSNSLIAALFACTTLLYAGCSTPESGNRPADGSCPSGEVCVGPPNGLFFSGTRLGDQIASETAPYAITFGGTQKIKVWLDKDASQPFSAPLHETAGKPSNCLLPNSTTPPAFCAIGGDHDLLSIKPNPPVVTVISKGLTGTGMPGTGQDELRITDPFNQNPAALYDLISLDVVVPSEMYVVTPRDLDFVLIHGARVHDIPIAFAVNSKPPAVVIGMFATTGSKVQRVVDESVSLSTSAGNLAGSPTQWDSLVPTGPFTQAQDYTITVTTNGQPPGQVTLKVVDTASSLEVASGSLGVAPGKPLIVGENNRVCFSSFTSAGGGVNMLIYGTKLSFQAAGNVDVTAVVGGEIGDTCVDVRPKAAGVVANIRVTYGGYQQLFAFDVAR